MRLGISGFSVFLVVGLALLMLVLWFVSLLVVDRSAE